MQIHGFVATQEVKLNQENSSKILIVVEEPVLNESETFAFFTYKIEGIDMNGPFSIRRRYRDFDLLRKRLSQRWLGIYVPPISGKRSQNNTKNIFKKVDNSSDEIRYAETRKRFLRYFCEGLAVRPYLFYCDLFQIFIRGGSDYDFATSNFIAKESSFIFNAYESSFKWLLEQNPAFELSALIGTNENHLSSLIKSEDNLLRIYDQILRTTIARYEFNNQFNHCMGTVLPQYEEKFLLSHVEKKREKLVLNKTDEMNLKLKELQLLTKVNPLEGFLELIMYQIRETKAFIEAIEGRKQAERRKCDIKDKIADKIKDKQKLINGNFSFRAVFKSGSKELQINELQMKIESLQNELQYIEKRIIIMVLNTNFQIEQYRQRRGKEYATLFKAVAGKEIVQLQAFNALLRIPLAALA